jgi:hypothetical protein
MATVEGPADWPAGQPAINKNVANFFKISYVRK